MTNEEKFKKTLQDKIESKEFSFDENDWEKAATFIDASRRSGNRGAMYVLSGTLFLLLSFISYNVVADLKTTEVKPELSQTPSLQTERMLLAEKMNASASTVHVYKPSSSTRVIKKNPAPSNISKEDLMLAANTTHEKTNSENVINPVQQQEKSVSENLSMANETQVPVENITQLPIETKALSPTASAQNTQTEIVALAIKPLESLASVTTETQKNSLVADENTTPSANTSEEKTVSVEAEESPKNVPIEIKENLSQPTVSDTVPKTLPIPVADIHNILNFEVGAAYLFGWKNPEGKDANGINAVVGINYLSHVNKQYWFSLGIQYTSVKNLNYSSKTSKVTRYKLGEESDVTTITPSTLHYLSFPLKLQYQLNDKNSFGLGYTANYLFNVESKVETYTETLYNTENHQSYTTGGYTEGFKLFSSQVAVFYRRQLMKDLWLNADFVFGLNDIKENSFFKINSFERNTGIKLTLTYNLFKH